jgi:hypothetical protein
MSTRTWVRTSILLGFFNGFRVAGEGVTSTMALQLDARVVRFVGAGATGIENRERMGRS